LVVALCHADHVSYRTLLCLLHVSKVKLGDRSKLSCHVLVMFFPVNYSITFTFTCIILNPRSQSPLALSSTRRKA
jgi:hypothetical protein